MIKAMDRLKNDLVPYQKDGAVIKGAALANGPPGTVDVQ